jgi:hypothetical protein
MVFSNIISFMVVIFYDETLMHNNIFGCFVGIGSLTHLDERSGEDEKGSGGTCSSHT